MANLKDKMGHLPGRIPASDVVRVPLTSSPKAPQAQRLDGFTQIPVLCSKTNEYVIKNLKECTPSEFILWADSMGVKLLPKWVKNQNDMTQLFDSVVTYYAKRLYGTKDTSNVGEA